MLLQPGHTCWRTAKSSRAAMILDVQDYFRLLKETLPRARRSILLAGWAFDPDTRLTPGPDGDAPLAERAGPFLRQLACARPELDVRVLIWKSSLPIAASQNFFPHRARACFNGTPVRFRLDGTVPFGACHHQKLVVIDDRLAFVGGADIGVDRWDTTEHLDQDPRRTLPNGKPHAARHEVMWLVEDEAAQALGDLFRSRWARAAHGPLAPPPVDLDPPELWPAGVEPDFHDATLGLSRSQPGWRDREDIRETESLHLAAIGAARRTIYLENQYFTSPVIAEALAARLAEPDGPEVVLVSTQHSPSWFDRMTMDRTRMAFLQRLQDADVQGRLHAYCPLTPGGGTIIVHAKLAVIDDVLLRIGSANLNNRSTGFDTECDVSLEAEPGPAGARTRAGIARARARLVGHWLGVDPAEVEAATARSGGLGAAIEALDAGRPQRRMQPLRPAPIGPLASLIATFHLGDPAGPQDSWAPWRRRRALRRQLAALARDLESQGLPSPARDLSAETV